MKLLFPIFALISLVLALTDYGHWELPRSGDVRSPCPALNAMANHNFIPHNGRNLTVPILVKGLGEGLNVSAETATALATLGISTSPDPSSGSFELDDLKAHNKIEHDASLSRKDFDEGGDAATFSPEIFNETLSYFEGKTKVGIPEVAKARWMRVESSRKSNDKFTYGEKQYFPSHFESAAYLQLFKKQETGLASVEWIKIYFSEERMPFGEGWRPVNRIDGLSIAQSVVFLALHTPEKLPVDG